MRRARFRRRTLSALVGLGVAGSAGCTHNYYYGNAVPVCPPTTAAATTTVVPYGSVCDVPSQVVVGGATVAPGLSGETVVSSAARPPRVVVSEPRGGSRLGWRRSDPDSSSIITKSEGALLDEPTMSR
jgi:hypothetical protein